MVALPKSEVAMVGQIYEAIEKTEKSPFRLARIGASGIGEDCLRASWLSWRGYAESTFDGRMYRLFGSAATTGGCGRGATGETAASSGSSWWARIRPGTSRPGGRT